MKEIKINSTVLFLFFSLLIIAFKLILSNFYYPDEDLLLKTIFDIESLQFIPIIKSYSEFDFSPIFELKDNFDYKNLAFPYLSLFLHSFSLKLIGLSSFFFLEFFGVFLFLIIFYNICRLINLNETNSIITTLLLFTVPNIASEINFFTSTELEMAVYNLKNLYNTRMPRPLISNLYFYLYILMIMIVYNNNKFSAKNAIFLAFLSGISLHSFFYFAFTENFLLIITVILKYKKDFFNHLKDKKKFYSIYIILNFLFLLSLFLIVNQINLDNYRIIGFHEIDFNQKLIILKSFLNYIFDKYFLFVFFLCYFLYYFIKKIENNLSIFFYLYLSSIIAFFFFILLYNKNIHYYYFQTLVIISSFIFIFLSFFKLLEAKIEFFKKNNYFYIALVFFICLSINYLIYFNKFNNKNENRNTINQLVKFIENDKNLDNKKLEILTFDSKVFSILYLMEYKNFTIVPNSFWTVRSISRIENDLILALKILNYNENLFLDNFKNIDLGYRVVGNYTNNFFGLIYLANKIIKYSNYNDFLINEANIIKKTSPFRTQQFIIPQSEYKRLEKKFKNYKNDQKNVDLVIINKNDKISEKYAIDSNKFCEIYMNEDYVIYKNKLYCS